ncbi:NFAT activation molecule 1 [Sphaeramia orbicularis]|uniref:NFAT activation molecule 1 n=1 Tax=Sphaeramia orbicularis TaxID=375764 RepID=UPI00117D1875|nr:uncharacterized protein LOC115428932 [Sphaeramia orbicularis]
MELQLFYNLSFIFTWIFVLSFASTSSGNDIPKIYLDNTVFVTFKGENLTIGYKLKKPPNQTQDILRCFDPSEKQIYSSDILGTGELAEDVSQSFVLENMVTSGEYHCQYKNAKAYWFLRVRDRGYTDVGITEYTEFTIVALFTGVLLVFSVVGSVYVFRGHWKCGNAGDERTQIREERKMEDNTNEVSSPSTSFYASLEARPRSIYDVLDHSAANTQPEQRKAKPKKDKTPKPVVQTTQNQDEGIFESVYENF